MIELPQVVANKARALGAQDWVEGLPATIEELCERWDVTIVQRYDDATEALVCEVVAKDRTPAVLKIPIPRESGAFEHELTVLRLADGEGCARLLRADLELGALLLEKLGPTLESLHLPLLDQHEILCTAVEKLWRKAPDAGLPTGAFKARWLQEFITATWAALDEPCDSRTIEHALACAERRYAAFDEELAVLVHGDVHEWNTLIAGDGFKLIDPDGLLAEAEYDLGVIMRESPLELLEGDPRRRSRWLARRCGLDEVAVWEWGVVERVSTGLLATRIDLQPIGRQMLKVADQLARES